MKCNERIKCWMHLCWEWCWVELFPTTLFLSHGAQQGIGMVKPPSTGWWRHCSVALRVHDLDTMYNKAQGERGGFRTHIWKGSPTSNGSRGHVIKTQPRIPVWMFLRIHIYLPAQIAEENQCNVYVCVHTSMKWSNNNSVMAAVFSFVII